MSLLRSLCAVLSALAGAGAQTPYPAKPVRRRSGEVKERLAREGGETVIMNRAEFTEFVRREIERWRKLAREANSQPEG